MSTVMIKRFKASTGQARLRTRRASNGGATDSGIVPGSAIGGRAIGVGIGIESGTVPSGRGYLPC
jgi:hypothetical protein